MQRVRARGFIQIGMEDPDKWQVAIALGKIEPVTDNEQIRNVKANVIGVNVLNTPFGLLEQHAGFQTARLQLLDLRDHSLQSPAGIEDVVHEQDVASTHVQAQLLGENQLAGFAAGAITRNPDEIQTQRQT